MTTVVPPSAPPPPPPASVPQATASVPAPPPALALLPVGARVEAIASLSDVGKGQVQVQSNLGSFILQTTVALPKDAQLVLQVLALAPQVQLLIASVDGKPPVLAGPRGATTPSTTSASPGSVAGTLPGTPAAAPATITLTVGTSVSATLVRPAPANSPVATPATLASVLTPPTAAPGTPGTNPETHATARGGARAAATPAGREATASISGASPSPPTTARSGLAASISPAPPPASEGRAPLPPAGTQFAFRIVAIQPPAAASTPPPPLGAGFAVGQILTGTVGGTTPTGQPVVQTPAGTVVLAIRAPLPVGTVLSLQLTSVPTPPTAAPTPERLAPLVTRTWPTLEETLHTLAEVDPAQRQHVLNAVLPRAESGLVVGLLTFLAALRGGDVRSWFGEGPLRALQRARPDLVERLDGDFRQLAKLADDPGAGDWRVALIPIGAQSEIEQARLLLRRQGGEETEKGPAAAGTRFVIDVSLSRLGRLQLDGLVREKGKRLDLIVRTTEPLPAAMREDIRRLFAEANAETNIGGTVAFQSAPAGFVEIPVERLVQGHVGLIA